MEWLTNPWISLFFEWVLKTSLLASVITILILIIKIVINNRLKPGWHYALWMILILRLLIPSGPLSEFSIENVFFKTHITSDGKVNSPFHLTENNSFQPSTSPEGPVVVKPETNMPDTANDPKHGDISWNVKQVITGIWIFVAIALLLRLLIVNIIFSMKLRKFAEPATLTDIQILKRAKKAMGIKRNIRLSFSTVVTMPTLFGLFRPHLIMPISSRELREERMYHIYLHELSHVKHADILVNWLMHLQMTLHWFNPLLWYALHRMREDQELSADDLAISRIDTEQVSEYGHTIIALLERYKLHKQIPGTAGLSGSNHQLKRRILMIKNFKKKSIGGTLAGLALMVALSGCALTNGKSASNENASKAPVDTTKQTTPKPSDTNSGDTQSKNVEKGNDDKNVPEKNTASGSGNVPTSSNTKNNQEGTVVPGSKQQPVQSSDTKGHEQQLKDIVALAKRGKVKGANFVSGKTTIEDIHSSWGIPDRPWQPTDRYPYDSYSPGAGRGTYAFGIGRGEVVYDIRYFGSPMAESQAFNKISFTEIKRTLGTPNSVKTNGGDDILIYKLGDYELKFVGPHNTQRLDHISVYSPKAAASLSNL